MTISLIIDFVILLALAAVFVFGIILWQRIAHLQDGLADLGPALQAFCDAVDQSERSVGQMRVEANRLQSEATRLETRIERGVQKIEPPLTKARADNGDLVKMFFDTARMRSKN